MAMLPGESRSIEFLVIEMAKQAQHLIFPILSLNAEKDALNTHNQYTFISKHILRRPQRFTK